MSTPSRTIQAVRELQKCGTILAIGALEEGQIRASRRVARSKIAAISLA
jgi:hypothetical protein